MAPEQAVLGSQVTDVRVDVYALGAILYELLTGGPPLDMGTGRTRSLTGILTRIHEEEAVRPSLRVQARRLAGKAAPFAPEALRGDLDWIVLKALEKSPDRRYESANALADDIQRHLRDEPVEAGPPNRWYAFKKLVRRNRLAFAISMVVAANVVLLAVVSTVGFLREADARANAEWQRRGAEINARHAAMESKKATALAEFLSQLLEQAGTFVEQGKNPEALRLAVDRSIASVQALDEQPELQAELLGRLAAIYKAMGDNNRALPLFQTQHDVLKRMFGENDSRTLESLLHLAGVTSGVGDKKKSLDLYEDLKRRWLAHGAAGLLQRKEALRSYARELSRQGQGAKAMEIMSLTLLLDEKGTLDVTALRFQADMQVGLGLHADAEASLLLALQQLGKSTRESLRTRGTMLQALSRCESKQGKLTQAAQHLEESIRCEQSERGDRHYTLIARQIEVSRLYVRMGRFEDAVHSTDLAVAIARETGSDEKLPKTLRAAGEIREEAGQLEAALAFRRECMGLERQNNTDRGKWLYELSEIARLQSKMELHVDAEKSCMELVKGIQAERQVWEDVDFLRSLYIVLADACQRWQEATGNTVHASDIEKWRAVANGQAAILP
jgi:tetratricopeptide (TPR) repeat protein